MKRYSILILFLIFSCTGNQDNFTLNGKIDGLTKGKIYLLESRTNNEVILDSSEIDNSSSSSCVLIKLRSAVGLRASSKYDLTLSSSAANNRKSQAQSSYYPEVLANSGS